MTSTPDGRSTRTAANGSEGARPIRTRPLRAAAEPAEPTTGTGAVAAAVAARAERLRERGDLTTTPDRAGSGRSDASRGIPVKHQSPAERARSAPRAAVRHRHAAPAGRLVAVGLSASAFLAGTRALDAAATTWSKSAGTGVPVAGTNPVGAPTASPGAAPPPVPQTVVVVHEVHHPIYVDQYGNPIPAGAVPASAPRPASPTPATTAPPTTVSQEAPPPPPPPAPACSGSRC